MNNAFMCVIMLSVVAAVTFAPGGYSLKSERSVQQETYFEQLLKLLEEKAKNQVENNSIAYSNNNILADYMNM